MIKQVPWCVVLIHRTPGPGAAGNRPRTSIVILGSEEELKTWVTDHPRQSGERREYFSGDWRPYCPIDDPEPSLAPLTIHASETVCPI